MEGHTDLHVTATSTLTAVKYQDEILRTTVIPNAAAGGPEVHELYFYFKNYHINMCHIIVIVCTATSHIQ